MGKYADKAIELFEMGYNCSQSVFCAFAPEFGFDTETALRISSGFGGGFARLREVCGAFSGTVMVIGLAIDTDFSDARRSKTDVYADVRKAAETFGERNGSLICREQLGLDRAEKSHVPEMRTPEYYKKRPCKEIIRKAALIAEEYFENNNSSR